MPTFFAEVPPGWSHGAVVVPADSLAAAWGLGPVLVREPLAGAYANAVRALPEMPFALLVVSAGQNPEVPVTYGEVFAGAVSEADPEAQDDPESWLDRWLAADAVLDLSPEVLRAVAQGTLAPTAVADALAPSVRDRAARPAFAEALRRASAEQLSTDRASGVGRSVAQSLVAYARVALSASSEAALLSNPMHRVFANLVGESALSAFPSFTIKRPPPSRVEPGDNARGSGDGLVAVEVLSWFESAGWELRKGAFRGAGTAAGEQTSEALLGELVARGLGLVEGTGDADLRLFYDAEDESFRIADVVLPGSGPASRIVVELRKGSDTVWRGVGDGAVRIPLIELRRALDGGADTLVLIPMHAEEAP